MKEMYTVRLHSVAQTDELRWSHIVGQFDSEVKVYSRC